MHVAVIPARAGSVGLPGKNRMFFQNTAEFLPRLPWIQRVIVSTDDPVVQEKAVERGFDIRPRPAHLAGPAVSVKAVIEDLVDPMTVAPDDVLWLFYLTVLYRSAPDFERARDISEQPGVRSVMSFVRAQTHPYSCWRWDDAGGRLVQYIENDVFRRQDLPDAWMAYHYTCCFRADELHRLNSELIAPGTRPIFIDDATAAKLVEIDTPDDLARWQQRRQQ